MFWLMASLLVGVVVFWLGMMRVLRQVTEPRPKKASPPRAAASLNAPQDLVHGPKQRRQKKSFKIGQSAQVHKLPISEPDTATSAAKLHIEDLKKETKATHSIDKDSTSDKFLFQATQTPGKKNKTSEITVDDSRLRTAQGITKDGAGKPSTFEEQQQLDRPMNTVGGEKTGFVQASSLTDEPEFEEKWEAGATSKKKARSKARKQRQDERGGPIIEVLPEPKRGIDIGQRATANPFEAREEPMDNTALHDAVLKRDYAAVKMLVATSPALLNVLNKYGDTPLDLCGDIHQRKLTGSFSAETKVAASPEIGQLLEAAGAQKRVKDTSPKQLHSLLSSYVPPVIAVVIVDYSQNIIHPLFTKPFALWTTFDAPDPRRPLPTFGDPAAAKWRAKIHFLTPNSVLQQVGLGYTVYTDLCMYRRGTWSHCDGTLSTNVAMGPAKQLPPTKDTFAFDVTIDWLTEWWKGNRKPSYSSWEPKEGEFETMDDMISIKRRQILSLVCEPRTIPITPVNDNLRIAPNEEFAVTGLTKEAIDAWAPLPPILKAKTVQCIYGDLTDINNDPDPAWCFAPWTLIVMADRSLKRADFLQVGDEVASEGLSTTIVCVVKMSGSGGCKKPLVSLGPNLVITAGHPIKPPYQNNPSRGWSRPHQLASIVSFAPTNLFNFVTSSRGSILLASFETGEPWVASTLGQFCSGIDLPGSFFGSERVVESLRRRSSWPNVEFTNQW